MPVLKYMVETHRMNRVSLVCTVHVESGQANVSELCAILEGIQPEVIFLEVPPEAFHDYYENCSRENLESKAVRQYREGHRVKLVPVDLQIQSSDFSDDNNRYLFRRVEAESREYCRLVDSNSANQRDRGFPYLNSEQSRVLWSNIYREIESSIKRMGDVRLAGIYKSWVELNDRRENTMLENILHYCRENTFDRGVFLVGAAHRQPIIEKSREQAAAVSSCIQWDFLDWLSHAPTTAGSYLRGDIASVTISNIEDPHARRRALNAATPSNECSSGSVTSSRRSRGENGCCRNRWIDD